MVSKRKNKNILNSKIASDIFNRRLKKKKAINWTSAHQDIDPKGKVGFVNASTCYKINNQSDIDDIYILIDLLNVDLDNPKLIDFKNYLLKYINL